MSIRGWLLLACAGFGATYVLGEIFHSPLLPAAEPLAWIALLAYLAVAGRDAPARVRIALAAGLLVMGGLAAHSWLSTVDSGSASYGFFAYQPPPTEENPVTVAAEAVRGFVPLLAGYTCLALAALFLPKRRTRVGTALAVAGVGAAVGYTVWELRDWDGLASLLAAVPVVLVAVLAFLLAGRISWWVPAAGLVLLGLATLALLGDVLNEVDVHPLYEANAFLEPGLRYGAQESVAISLAIAVGPGALGLELIPAFHLAAAAVLTAGCLRAAAIPPKAAPPDATAPDPS